MPPSFLPGSSGAMVSVALSASVPETWCLRVQGLEKRFVLHHQGGVTLPVLQQFDLTVAPGECLVLEGPSGSGKSTVLRLLYGNYLANAGSIQVVHAGAWVELVGATPQTILAVREQTLGYTSQFLRVIPRVAAVDIVAEPLRRQGVDPDAAHAEAGRWLQRLQIPSHLWNLPPGTFSGGEQQRVNIAHGLIRRHPILLLDEPTASLDARNRQVVIELIHEALQGGAAIVGIFHDAAVRDAVATRRLSIRPTH